MKKMILFFSHNLTDEQREDAKSKWYIEAFLTLPAELQTLWSNVPAQLEDIEHYLEPMKAFLLKNVSKDDIVLVQGDFGATYKIVTLLKSFHIAAVYATTKREVEEKEVNGKIVKTSVFKHIRFRRY